MAARNLQHSSEVQIYPHFHPLIIEVKMKIETRETTRTIAITGPGSGLGSESRDLDGASVRVVPAVSVPVV